MDNTVKNDKKNFLSGFSPSNTLHYYEGGGVGGGEGEGSQRFYCTYGLSTFVLYTTWKLAKKLLRKMYEQCG